LLLLLLLLVVPLLVVPLLLPPRGWRNAECDAPALSSKQNRLSTSTRNTPVVHPFAQGSL
jgi:hypothetical protein